MTSLAVRQWVTVAILFAASAAHADIIVGNFGGSGLTRAGRYRESDGALLASYGIGDETVQGVAYGSNGNVYMSGNSVGFGHIEAFSGATGADLGNFVSSGAFGYQVPNALTIIGNHVFSTSENFNSGTDGVMTFNLLNGAYLGVGVAPNTNGLSTPEFLYTATNGDLLVSDGRRINRYNPSTFSYLGTFATASSLGISNFGIAAPGPDGYFYVGDGPNHRILRVDGTTGAFVSIFASSINGPFAFGNDGNLYVTGADLSNGHIDRYNGATGAFMDTIVPNSPLLATATFVINAPNLPEPGSVIAFTGLCSALVRRRAR